MTTAHLSTRSGRVRRARARIVAIMATATVLTGIIAVPGASVAGAVATNELAEWQMNEPRGARTMIDSSGNGIHGAIGSDVVTGYTILGATGYNWPHTAPNAPPPRPGRLIQVSDSRLNPGSRDYAITVRFRTTHSYGNMIQKGQSTTPGGYFKWEIPRGRLTCLFRSRDQNGNIIGEKSVKSPLDMPLNDGDWHTVRCEKTADRVTMTIDGSVTVSSRRGFIGPISNTFPLTIAGKLRCDQVDVTCDYFAGQIDYIRIETS